MGVINYNCLSSFKLNYIMNEKLIPILQNYWFSEKEARIYLTLLSLWESQASTISRNIWEKRTTTYSILKEMIKKWYISEIEKNSTFQYSVVSPEILLWNMEKKYLNFKEVLPELLWLMDQNSMNVNIQYFYWDSWLDSLFLDFANSDIEVKTFAWTWKYNNEILLQKSKIYIQKRTEKWLLYKRIISRHNIESGWNESEDVNDMKNKDKLYGRQTAIVDNLDDIHADIDIYWPWKVSFLFFKNGVPNIIIINNQLIYDCLNTIFDTIWQQNYK